MGRSEVWVAALFFGQAKPEPKDLDKLSELTGIDRAVRPTICLQDVPFLSSWG